MNLTAKDFFRNLAPMRAAECGLDPAMFDEVSDGTDNQNQLRTVGEGTQAEGREVPNERAGKQLPAGVLHRMREGVGNDAVSGVLQNRTGQDACPVGCARHGYRLTPPDVAALARKQGLVFAGSSR